MYKIEHSITAACPLKEMLEPKLLVYRVNILRSHMSNPTVSTVELRLSKTKLDNVKSQYNQWCQLHNLPASALNSKFNHAKFGTTLEIVEEFRKRYKLMEKAEIDFDKLQQRLLRIETSARQLRNILAFQAILINHLIRIFPEIAQDVRNFLPLTFKISSCDKPDNFAEGIIVDTQQLSEACDILFENDRANFVHSAEDFIQLFDVIDMIKTKYFDLSYQDYVSYHTSLTKDTQYNMKDDMKFDYWYNHVMFPAFGLIDQNPYPDTQFSTDESKVNAVISNISNIPRFKSHVDKWSKIVNGKKRHTVEVSFLKDFYDEVFGTDNLYWTLQAKDQPLVKLDVNFNNRDNQKRKIEQLYSGSDPSKRYCSYCWKQGHEWKTCNRLKSNRPMVAKPNHLTFKTKVLTQEQWNSKRSKLLDGDTDNSPPTTNHESKKSKKSSGYTTINCIECHSDIEDVYNTESADDTSDDTNVIVDSASAAHIFTAERNGCSNIRDSKTALRFADGSTLPTSKAATFHNIPNVVISSSVKKQIASTYLLAKDHGMMTIVSKSGAYTLKPNTELQIPNESIVATAKDINGFFRYSANQFSKIAKAANPITK
jgi:hypothetical protein